VPQTATDDATTSAAPTYRLFRARVARTVRVTPHFVRLTFSGPDLAEFGYAGHDQRVKLLLPQPGRTLDDVPTGADWYLRWRELPDRVRPTMRTYTVRAFRPAEHELDVDFVVHGTDGGAPGVLSSWADQARRGDEIGLLGPDRPGSGRLWGAEWAPPPGTGRVLVLGDETALPAITAILNEAPARLQISAYAEVPDPADAQGWDDLHATALTWLVRRRPGGEVPRGALLEACLQGALRAACDATGPPGAEPDGDADELLWDVPTEITGAPAVYVWMAGEAGVMRELRRIARRDFGLPRTAVACMGYWREGASEAL
jgi:NADPH-dependent ferric siderophore reductase